MSRPGHGPDGSPHGQDFAEFLRHALHAAADQVEPRPDGLERIRARVRAGTEFTTENAEAPVTDLRPGGWIRHRRARLGGTAVPGALTHKAAASGRHGGSKSGPARPPLDWRQRMIRPVVAVACAVFAIGVALSLPPLRAAFVQLGSSVGLSSQHTNGATSPSSGSPGRALGSASGSTLGVGTTPAASAASPAVTVCPPSSSAAPANTAKPASKPSKTVTPTPTTTPQVPASTPPTTPPPTDSSPAETVSPSSSVTTSGSPDTSTTATATPEAFTKTTRSTIKTTGTDCVSSSAVITPTHSAKVSTPPVKGKAKGSPSATAETSPTSPASGSTSPSGGDTGVSNGQNSASPSDSASGTNGTQTATPHPHRHH
jgi:hypothetical protein